MKRITKVFLVLGVCTMSLSCSKDDDEGGGDGYVCYQCTQTRTDGWSKPEILPPICGEKTWVELTVQSLEEDDGSGYIIRCVRKK